MFVGGFTLGVIWNGSPTPILNAADSPTGLGFSRAWRALELSLNLSAVRDSYNGLWERTKLVALLIYFLNNGDGLEVWDLKGQKIWQM
jgi:hypothetical protein